jgi:hypothetical protein
VKLLSKAFHNIALYSCFTKNILLGDVNVNVRVLFVFFFSVFIGIVDAVKRQEVVLFDAFRDVSAKIFYPEQAEKIPILSVSQLTMRSYHKRFGKFVGAAVLAMNGFFSHKLAVNVNA